MDLATSTLEAIQNDIDAAAMRLAKQTITENFGQREVSKLQDKYQAFLSDYWAPDAAAGRRMINNFNSWCMSFTGVTV